MLLKMEIPGVLGLQGPVPGRQPARRQHPLLDRLGRIHALAGAVQTLHHVKEFFACHFIAPVPASAAPCDEG